LGYVIWHTYFECSVKDGNVVCLDAAVEHGCQKVVRPGDMHEYGVQHRGAAVCQRRKVTTLLQQHLQAAPVATESRLVQRSHANVVRLVHQTHSVHCVQQVQQYLRNDQILN
jgi:hypothetical protein